MAFHLSFPAFLQVVSAIPVHLDGKSAPGQVPTGSVCYERNGVSGIDYSSGSQSFSARPTFL